MIVLDSSALIAAILNEPGAEMIMPHLAGAFIGAANLSECMERLLRDGVQPEVSLAGIIAQGVRIVDVSAKHAGVAAQLRPTTKTLGLSLGDRLCLALALERSATVLTAEQIWSQVNIGLKIDIIRTHKKNH